MFDIIDNSTERVFIIREEELAHINLLEERVMEFARKDIRDVVVDLQKLAFIDSVTLSVFIRIKRKLSADGRIFILKNYNQTILRIIELAGLDGFLLE